MILERCFHHEFREAASRCPICLRYFCRECVTEHDDRVLCAECLKKVVAHEIVRISPFRRMLRGLLPIAGLLMAWLFFYALGRTLLLIPAAVHDGTLWESR
jgi:hypothetical protein